jgi:hypothetical protein
MSTLKETVFVGKDNEIRLLLKEDDIVLMTAYPSLVPSRWQLTIASDPEILIDSDTNPDAFNWISESSILELAIGSIVTTAMGYTSATLRMYAPIFPNGVVLIHPTCTPDKLKIRICDEG